ncbi:MAG TPA: hypothetical protein VN940_09660 [Candidatus Dormibacteraeota bacterium]|nr:hypothetical protein [Candidatus Dormibacteraeota bacterium]
MIEAKSSSRPEAAFVLLLMQAMLWTIAGLSAIPFALAGEVYMLGLGIASLLLALGTCLLAIGVLWRRRSARRWVLLLEVVCLIGSLLVLLLPIGANHGPVALMTNVALPIAVIVLLRKQQDAFL